MPKRNAIYAVILVGGKGKRLRPLSTNSRPKAFLSVTKDRKTMFRRTVDRAKRIASSSNIIVVANRCHSRLVKRDISHIENKNLLLEPVSRNTAPAIMLAASVLKKRTRGGAIMVVLPTDQYVADEERYIDSIKDGIAFARNNDGVLIVLGVKPKFPSTEYGYIRINQKSKISASAKTLRRIRQSAKREGGKNQKFVYKVEKFVEKPDLNTAKGYIKSKRYLWNAGGFIFKVDAILGALERLAPAIFNRLKNLRYVNALYHQMPDISIDYAIMEKADSIYCVKGEYGWQDMGSFDSLKEILRRESRSFVERGGKIIKII